MEIDLINVDPIREEHMHKLKRQVQCPNSYFMDVKCQNCYNTTVVFSHAQSAVQCEG